MQGETHHWSNKLSASKKKSSVYQKQLSLVSLDRSSVHLDRDVFNLDTGELSQSNINASLGGSLHTRTLDTEIQPRNIPSQNYQKVASLSHIQSDTSGSNTVSPKCEIGKPTMDNMDSYTAGIELSNACRNYYVNKIKAADKFKDKLCRPVPHLDSGCHGDGDGSRVTPLTDSVAAPQTSLQGKMVLLKKELMSLIDVDLSLMRQFLMLNEQIEEMKWRRKMHTYKSHNASSRMSSLSTTSSRPYMSTLSSMTASHSQVLSAEYLDLKYPSPSELSIFNSDCYSTTETLSPSNLDVRLQDVEEENTSDLGSDSDDLDRTITADDRTLDRPYTARSEPDLLDTIIPRSEPDLLDTFIPINQAGSYCELDKRFSKISLGGFETNTLNRKKNMCESVDLDTVIPPCQADSEADLQNAASHKYFEIPQSSPGQLRKFESTILWPKDQSQDNISSTAKCATLPAAPSSQCDFDSELDGRPANTSIYGMKCSTLSSTGSNESTSTEGNSTDSGISDHDTTVEFVTHF